MKRKRFHFFNHWIDFSYCSGAFRVGYGRDDLYVKTLLFVDLKKPSKPPSLMLDNLGISIENDDEEMM
jgi:hypothetical protein